MTGTALQFLHSSALPQPNYQLSLFFFSSCSQCRQHASAHVTFIIARAAILNAAQKLRKSASSSFCHRASKYSCLLFLLLQQAQAVSKLVILQHRKKDNPFVYSRGKIYVYVYVVPLQKYHTCGKYIFTDLRCLFYMNWYSLLLYT